MLLGHAVFLAVLVLRGDKVNLYLREADVLQRVTRNEPANSVRRIVLRRATGHEEVLWQGTQNDGALVPYLP